MNGDLNQGAGYQLEDTKPVLLGNQGQNINVNYQPLNQQPYPSYQQPQPQINQQPQYQQNQYQPPQMNQQAYSQPNVSNNNNVTPIIVNSQNGPAFVQGNNPNIFKSNSVLATCVSCRNVSNTRVQTDFNWGNYCCYYCFGPIIWIIYQAARDKDISCMDANHYCSACGNLVHSYKSC